MSIAAVVIGRNEGARLLDCLASLPAAAAPVVYVDSGSTDGSPAAARAAGAEVVALDLAQPFTAARARNAGVGALEAMGARPRYIQFVDGDCTLAPGWIETAATFLDRNPQAAVACGRRRERFPEASVYNRLCDREWDTPVGRARNCGGDALMRTEAFAAVGGFNPVLIAGEEPELCVRLRKAGWKIWRLDAEMTLHDAAMTRFSQWWKRARRAGYAYALRAALHGAAPERDGVSQTLRSLFWGVLLPVVALGGTLVSLWALTLLLAYPAQVVRLAWREGPGRRASWEYAVLLTLGRFAMASGALEYLLRTGLRRPARLMEYK